VPETGMDRAISMLCIYDKPHWHCSICEAAKVPNAISCTFQGMELETITIFIFGKIKHEQQFLKPLSKSTKGDDLPEHQLCNVCFAQKNMMFPQYLPGMIVIFPPYLSGVIKVST
jgi:hypothetical protein